MSINNFRYKLNKNDTLSVEEYNRINRARQQMLEAQKSAESPSMKTLFNFVKNKVKNVEVEPIKLINTTDIYMNEILSPVIKRIDDNAIIDKFVTVFPIYGNINPIETYDDKGKENLDNEKNPDIVALTRQAELNISRPYIRDDVFGKWLYMKNIIPIFNEKFISEIYIDTLSENDEGICFINGKGISKITDDNKRLIEKTDFEGPILVVKHGKYLKGDISLYTTKIDAYNERTRNGYLFPDNIINTDNDIFDKNFITVSNDKSEVDEILADTVKEKLLELKEKYNNFGIYMHKNYMIIGLNIKRIILTKHDIECLEPNEYLHNIYDLFFTAYEFKDIMRH